MRNGMPHQLFWRSHLIVSSEGVIEQGVKLCIGPQPDRISAPKVAKRIMRISSIIAPPPERTQTLRVKVPFFL